MASGSSSSPGRAQSDEHELCLHGALVLQWQNQIVDGETTCTEGNDFGIVSSPTSLPIDITLLPVENHSYLSEQMHPLHAQWL